MSQNLLELRNVSKVFRIGGLVFGTRLVAVDDVSLSLPAAEPSILSIVGESGSGKTTLARIILELEHPTSGDVLIEGHPLFEKSGAGLKGRDYYRAVQPIFQNPFEAFSARKRVDKYLFDAALRLKIAASRKEAREIVAEVLESVGLDLSRVEGKYANQFSGGELQRISVARGLIPRPKLIVADEPVSMIDASLRMNIVNLFLELKEQYKVYVSDYIGIMYRGSVVEYGPSEQILTDSAHPYTELLLDSVPTVDHKWERQVALPDIEIKEFQGDACKFAKRCKYVQPICERTVPPMVQVSAERQALCYKPVDFDPEASTPQQANEALAAAGK
ncbi:MAG: ABC transporter ATP-binding protein [Chloroflexi bacterium]|nr:ABC transporter ATP-binding protein [Chloroflexota bacterium]